MYKDDSVTHISAGNYCATIRSEFAFILYRKILLNLCTGYYAEHSIGRNKCEATGGGWPKIISDRTFLLIQSLLPVRTSVYNITVAHGVAIRIHFCNAVCYK